MFVFLVPPLSHMVPLLAGITWWSCWRSLATWNSLTSCSTNRGLWRDSRGATASSTSTPERCVQCGAQASAQIVAKLWMIFVRFIFLRKKTTQCWRLILKCGLNQSKKFAHEPFFKRFFNLYKKERSNYKPSSQSPFPVFTDVDAGLLIEVCKHHSVWTPIHHPSFLKTFP